MKRIKGTLAVLAVATLAACGGPPGAAQQVSAGAPAPELKTGQKVSITFESYNLMQAGVWTETVTQLVREFQQQHPDITVTARPPQGQIENLTAGVQQQIVAGAPPDVAQLTFGDLDFIVNGLRAKPIEDVAGRQAVQEHFEAGHPMHPRARTLADFGGKTYGVPYVFSTPTLFYNADLFEKAGLDPAKPPKTWKEVKEAGLALKKSGKQGVYLGCLGQGAADWCLQAIIRSNGGRVLAESGKELTFAAPQATEALAMWQDLVTSGAHPDLGTNEATESFARGDLGMLLNSSALQGMMQQASAGKWKLGSAAMPGFEGREAVPTNSGSALFTFATDPAKQRAAWELMKFLTSDRAYTLISSRIGYLPLRTGLIDDPKGLKSWAEKNPLFAPNLAQLDRLEPWVSFPGPSYLQIRDLMDKAAQEVVYRGKDPKATMAQAQDRASALLPKGRP
ncbi:ABC transporter substrate-binding protein [Spongiactinospora sp. 9N601]|uniref:ABC transporter substrate-binding protein n=1 Tax=Spongiactinospora sp. 9N601 TaxID=3375149 RepID=UPI00378E7D3C